MAQRGQGGARHGHGAEQVGLHRRAPGVEIAAAGERADIGDDDVDPAHAHGRLFDPDLQRIRVGDVHGGAEGPVAERLRGLRDAARVACAEADLRAFFQKGLDDRPADAARSAADDDFASTKLVAGEFSLSVVDRYTPVVDFLVKKSGDLRDLLSSQLVLTKDEAEELARLNDPLGCWKYKTAVQ